MYMTDFKVKRNAEIDVFLQALNKLFKDNRGFKNCFSINFFISEKNIYFYTLSSGSYIYFVYQIRINDNF